MITNAGDEIILCILLLDYRGYRGDIMYSVFCLNPIL